MLLLIVYLSICAMKISPLLIVNKIKKVVNPKFAIKTMDYGLDWWAYHYEEL